MCLLTLALLTTGERAPALGPSFSYQGQIVQNGVPVGGNCDLQFSLFGVASGGTPLGNPQTIANASLSNGAFTAQLNGANEFGTTVFMSGADRFLEIAIRCPAGAGSFVTLSPRQMVVATPYAQFASSVGSNAVVSGAIVDGTIATADSPTTR